MIIACWRLYRLLDRVGLPRDRDRTGPLGAVLFTATLNVTVPFPPPEAPPVTVIHDALLTALQAQPLPAVTFTEPDVAAAETEVLVALSW